MESTHKLKSEGWFEIYNSIALSLIKTYENVIITFLHYFDMTSPKKKQKIHEKSKKLMV